MAFQGSKEMNVSKELFITVKTQLASIIEEMAKNDEEGKFKEEFHEILKLSLSMGGHIRKIRELVNYFLRHSLNTNQEIIDFLIFMNKNSQISDYGYTI